MDRHHPGLRPHRVVELRRGERLTEVGIPVRIAGTFECQHRDVVHPEVIGVRVAGLVVAVGDDHLRPLTADDRHQPARGLVDVGLVEAVRVVVRFGVGHARVAIAEHLDHVEADDLRRRRQFAGPHRRHERSLLVGVETVERLARFAQRRVLQVALLATGAADQDRVDAARRDTSRTSAHPSMPRRRDGRERSTTSGVRSPEGGYRSLTTTMPDQPLDAPTLRRVRRHDAKRWTAIAAAVACALFVAGCDTGDGDNSGRTTPPTIRHPPRRPR